VKNPGWQSHLIDIWVAHLIYFLNSYLLFNSDLALNHLIERLSYYSGFNPFAPTWKFDRHRSFHLFNIAMGFLTTFFCMYEAKSGTEIVIRSMGLGIFTQTFLKCFLIIIGADSYQQLIAQIEILYRSKDKKTQEVMTKRVDLCEKIYNIISVVNSSAVLIFIGYPWVTIFFMDKPTLMFPFYIPFLDPHHYVGFTAASLFHSILIIYTLLFHNAFDIAFINFTVHAIAMVDLIKIDYDELAEFAEKSNADNEQDMKVIRQKLKGIVEAQKLFDSYIDKLNKLYEWPCFVTSSTSIFSICIALILIMIVKLPVAYGLCWALFGQLFCSYMNGEVINHQVSAQEQLERS